MAQCYCAHYLTPGAVPADAADCKFPCAGNSAELCGGDWRFNLYEFDDECDSDDEEETTTTTSALPAATSGPATYTSEGCYTEAKGIRALSDVAFYDDAMTVEKCAAACAGYTWFGVEYGRECYGGNTIHSAEGSVPTSLSECSFPCPGNPTQKCGAGDRLNMYRFLSASASTSSDTPVETTTSTTSEAVTAPEPTSTSTSPAVEPTPTVPAAEPTTTSTTVIVEATTSTTTSAAAAATTTTPPAPKVNVLTNGNFEGSGGWTIKVPVPGALTYSFVDMNAAFNGRAGASVAYAAGAGAYPAWFNQVVTLKPNTRYNFSAWSKASSANPGCAVYFYIATPDGTETLKTMAQVTSANQKPQWTQSTGFYDVGADTQYSFNVRWGCSSSIARTYYVDELILIEAPAA